MKKSRISGTCYKFSSDQSYLLDPLELLLEEEPFEDGEFVEDDYVEEYEEETYEDDYVEDDYEEAPPVEELPRVPCEPKTEGDLR